MTTNSYTNSFFTTHRACPRKAHIKYDLLLGLSGFSSEALEVGTCWHKAHDEDVKKPTGDEHAAAYAAIREFSPSDLWNEKLRRLYAAYHWYWKDQPLEIIESERTFSATLPRPGGPVLIKGQLDGRVRNASGSIGMIERKTTGDSIETDSLYWDRLRMDPQTGTYALALDPLPNYILYDVVRKPTINPKKISKKDVARLRAELVAAGSGTYYDVNFSQEEIGDALDSAFESLEMYGARLTADIGDRPGFYFARREVVRTKQDFETVLENIESQVDAIEHARETGVFFMNPDSCALFGRCEYFSLCSNNIVPCNGDPTPEGFSVREHRHPELHDQQPKTEE